MLKQTVPRTVGRYEILRELGRGGMAVVYLARQTDLDRLVALKELAAFRAGDPTVVQRFLRESRLTGSMNHPNIVTVHEYFEVEGTAYIAMEYFERGSLRPLLRTLALPQVGRVLEGILAGLGHAEQRGIVHRDLKPENVMVTAEGSVKIADFGIAKALQDQAHPALTTTDSTVGTPAYMAPEQAMGGEVGAWTDLYAVGMVAYEMLAGRLPFDETEMPMAVLLRQINEPFPRLDALDPTIDAALADWVADLIAKDPAERPRGAGQAWEGLEDILLGRLGPRWRRDARLPAFEATTETLVRPAPTSRLERTTRLVRRPRRLLALAALPALLAAGVLAAFALDNGDGTGDRTTRATTTSVVQPALDEAALLRSVHTRQRGHDLLLTLAVRPGKPPARLVLRDDTIIDGRASFVLWGKHIAARLTRWSRGPVVLAIERLPNRLLVSVRTKAGLYERLSASRHADSVLLRLHEAQPAQTTTEVLPPPAPPPPPVTPPASPPPSAPPPAPPPTQPSQRTSTTTPSETVGG